MVELKLKLKPCPFCGGKVMFNDFVHRRFFNTKLFYYVECSSCGIRTSLCEDEFFATEKWNRRADNAAD